VKFHEPFVPCCEFTNDGPVSGLGVKITLVIGMITPFKVTETLCDAGVACPATVSVNEIWLGVATNPLPPPELLPTVSVTFTEPVIEPFAVTPTEPLYVAPGVRFEVLEALRVKLLPLTVVPGPVSQFPPDVVLMGDTKRELIATPFVVPTVTIWLAVTPGPEIVRATGLGENVRV
jgi:hypothetical protein